MLPNVVADDWPNIDDWWGSRTSTHSVRYAPAHLRAVEPTARTDDWESVDGLSDGFETDHEPLFTSSSLRAVTDSPMADAWSTVDPFWDGYAAEQLPELRQLQDLLTTVRDRWDTSPSTFDADPLTANWEPSSQFEGPLRSTVDEEDWSQWLAHLLRTSAGPFIAELFGLPERSPETVRREIVFSADDVTRRIDILVEYPDAAASIEVKNGDTNYGKTPETARLVEREDRRDWTHVLLLQQSKEPRLQQTFGDSLVTNKAARPTIQSNVGPPVEVCYWQDISHALRRMLTEGCEPDSHWQASAYLFVTLIEQRILNLHSVEVIDPETGIDGVSPAKDLHRLVAIEPERQIDYLQTLLAEDTKHE